MPYAYVVGGFFLGLIFLFLIIDNWIMPAIVSGEASVYVPNLTGKTLADAESVLNSEGLNYKVTKEIYSEKFRQGCVVSQMPGSGVKVKSGRPIYITLSKGKETVAVPYLIGSDQRTARTMLVQRGLELGVVYYDFSDSYSKGLIIMQSVNAGSYVPYGNVINITLSKGPMNQSKIPMLVGLSYDEIQTVITESGFVLGEVTYQKSETYLPNVVIDQYPSADETAVAGTSINITVSK